MTFNSKGAFQMSFTWLFAIIVGGFILFLAIYFAAQIGNTEEHRITTEGAAIVQGYFSSVETSIESSVSPPPIIFPLETRLYNNCEEFGEFGVQKISLSEKVRGRFSEVGGEVSSNNNYVFSKDEVQGREFAIFSKPFEYPFKVANLIYLTSTKTNYCFNSPPEVIEDEIGRGKQINLNVENCSSISGDFENVVNVCFSGQGGRENRGCDVVVSYSPKGNIRGFSEGYVERTGAGLGDRSYFVGDSMMYAAIFSDEQLYLCQSKRLMKRLGILSELYLEKSKLLATKRCNSGLESELFNLRTLTESYESDNDLLNMKTIVQDLDEKNFQVECKLW